MKKQVLKRIKRKIRLWKIKRDYVKQLKYCMKKSCFLCGKHENPKSTCPYYVLRMEYIKRARSGSR